MKNSNSNNNNNNNNNNSNNNSNNNNNNNNNNGNNNNKIIIIINANIIEFKYQLIQYYTQYMYIFNISLLVCFVGIKRQIQLFFCNRIHFPNLQP